jgi:hypothetical protein
MSRAGRKATTEYSDFENYVNEPHPSLAIQDHAIKRRSRLATTSMLYSIWKSNQICYDMYNYIGSMKIPEDDVDQRRFRMKKIMQLGNHFARVEDSLQQAKERCIEEGTLDPDFDFEDHDEMMAELDTVIQQVKPSMMFDIFGVPAGTSTEDHATEERLFKFDSEAESLEDVFKDITIDFLNLPQN